MEKTYVGPDADVRRAREHGLLVELQGQIPVPPVHGLDGGTLRLGFVEGAPGQELLDAGHGEAVLRASGLILSRIHRISRPDGVLVHGDFGPNNLLLDPVTFEVRAVVDWEFAHVGSPVEDLAWCEWIVRMHHPDQRAALPWFFDAYAGPVPGWSDRQAAMVALCEDLKRFCERWEPGGPAVDLWRDRAAATAAWTD